VPRRASRSLWLDRALCAVLALLSVAALTFGLVASSPAMAGVGCFGLVCAGWAAQVLFDREALRRSAAVRAAVRAAIRAAIRKGSRRSGRSGRF
jgi:protein-S-isoprenylcysteine O-methyltransferase Ste14